MANPTLFLRSIEAAHLAEFNFNCLIFLEHIGAPKFPRSETSLTGLVNALLRHPERPRLWQT
jgi:hypothetical protein